MARLSVLESALLGLLWREPSTGYDLRRVFQTTPLGTYSDSPGSIYPALRRLERDGFIRGRAQSDGRRRYLVELTARGREALRRWLDEPITLDDVIKRSDELDLRFAFMSDVGSPGQARAFLQAYERQLTAFLHSVEQYVAEHAAELPQSGRLALDLGVRLLRTRVEWCVAAARSVARVSRKPSTRGKRRAPR